MKKYKYLVVCGCSLSYGQHCPTNQTYAKLLADKLGLTLINLSTPATGWYSVETNITSFIQNNKSIIDECFFILQKSMLDRRVNYEEVSTCRTDVWEKWNIKYMSPINVLFHGFNDWYTYFGNDREKVYTTDDISISQLAISIFPEHKRSIDKYNKGSFHLKLEEGTLNVQEVFEEIMLHWAMRINSFHLFLKNLNLDHIIVDGYSPFLSYKLNFTNYYDTDDDYEMVKKFWSTQPTITHATTDFIFDFKNIKAGWIFDSIDIKYKIDDVVLWGLYLFKPMRTAWNIDGGHAGPLGMQLIANTIYKNLVDKGWFLPENI